MTAELSNSIALWTDESATVRFHKGRVALYALLKSAGIGPGDEVLVPGLTCVVVPAAVLYTGARPVFFDIDPTTYNGTVDAAKAARTGRTRAVLVQHSFGLPCDGPAFRRWADREGLWMLEDCAHALGASLAGAPAGSFGHGAFASFQWSKPVSCGLGGIARANADELVEPLRRIHADSCDEPALASSLNLALLHELHRHLFRPELFWHAQGLYRALANLGLVAGSSSGPELREPVMPGGYLRRFGRRRVPQLESALRRAKPVIERRRRIAQLYRTVLGGWGDYLPRPEPGGGGIELRLPLRVRHRDELLAAARRRRIELGDWFNAPLHPGEAATERFGYVARSCPEAEDVAAQLINLPTHERVTESGARRILAFLEARRDRLVPLDALRPAEPLAAGIPSPPRTAGAAAVS